MKLLLRCWEENILINHCHWFENHGYRIAIVCANTIKYERRGWFSVSMHANLLLYLEKITKIAKFMGPTWGTPGSCWSQIGPMLAPMNLAIRALAALKLHAMYGGHYIYHNLVYISSWFEDWRSIFKRHLKSNMRISFNVCGFHLTDLTVDISQSN